MMDRAVTTTIDTELCIGCGACVEVCPSDTLTLRGGHAVVTGEESLNCGHCQAVCPEGAVTVGSLVPASTSYATFEADERWLAPGDADLTQLVRLMASRRSCRNYRRDPVDRAALDDLVKIGATAPSGTNSQGWSFTVLPTREAVVALGEMVAGFYELLNKLVERKAVRVVGRLTGQAALQHYYENYYERIKEGLEEFRSGGRERLFHGATAAILVGSLPGASTPGEDALLAVENILLAAHAMGLGSCLIGFAVQAIKRDPRIPRKLRLERGERIHAVIGLGHPDETYQRTTGRLAIPIRSWRG